MKGLKSWFDQSRVLDGVLVLREWALGGLAWTRSRLRRLLSHVIPLTIWRPRPAKPRSCRLQLTPLESREAPINLLADMWSLPAASAGLYALSSEQQFSGGDASMPSSIIDDYQATMAVLSPARASGAGSAAVTTSF